MEAIVSPVSGRIHAVNRAFREALGDAGADVKLVELLARLPEPLTQLLRRRGRSASRRKPASPKGQRWLLDIDVQPVALDGEVVAARASCRRTAANELAAAASTSCASRSRCSVPTRRSRSPATRSAAVPARHGRRCRWRCARRAPTVCLRIGGISRRAATAQVRFHHDDGHCRRAHRAHGGARRLHADVDRDRVRGRRMTARLAKRSRVAGVGGAAAASRRDAGGSAGGGRSTCSACRARTAARRRRLGAGHETRVVTARRGRDEHRRRASGRFSRPRQPKTAASGRRHRAASTSGRARTPASGSPFEVGVGLSVRCLGTLASCSRETPMWTSSRLRPHVVTFGGETTRPNGVSLRLQTSRSARARSTSSSHLVRARLARGRRTSWAASRPSSTNNRSAFGASPPRRVHDAVRQGVLRLVVSHARHGADDRRRARQSRRRAAQRSVVVRPLAPEPRE